MLRLLLAIGMAVLSTVSHAADFDTNQFNLKVKGDSWGVEFREYSQSDRSHIQLEHYLDKWKFAYRYDENGDKVEHRPRIDYKLFSNDYFYITPRIEYRYYEGDRDDYGRLRSAFGLKWGNAYYEITPMIHFAKDNSDNDFGFDEYQQKVGYKWKLDDKVKLNTFVQHEADNNFDKTNLFFGTGLEVNF
jgi:hypothetical protein